MLTKIYYQGAEILSAFLNGVKVFGSDTVPVEPSGDMGLRANYSGTGWYKATDSGTVFSKDVPALETHVFSDSPKEYVSVYTKDDARLYGERAATSNITNMSNMFNNKTSFNQDLSSWDVSNVTDMSSMFFYATSFNQNISSWDVSSVTTIGSMFSNATSFNQNISSWDVSSVTYAIGMFNMATSFNQDISGWDVSSVTDMMSMFYGAAEFNQDLSQWCVTKIKTAPDYFNNNTQKWTLPKPVWGTCPRGENLP